MPTGTPILTLPISTSWGGVTDDTWHHVAAAYDGNNLYHYVDGNLIDSHTDPGAITYTGPPHFSIGTRNAEHPGNFFNRIIDKVKLFNTALTQAEIQSAMMIPEPTTLTLLLMGLIGLARTRFRPNRSSIG